MNLTTTLQQQLEAMEFGSASVKETLNTAQKALTDLMGQHYKK